MPKLPQPLPALGNAAAGDLDAPDKELVPRTPDISEREAASLSGPLSAILSQEPDAMAVLRLPGCGGGREEPAAEAGDEYWADAAARRTSDGDCEAPYAQLSAWPTWGASSPGARSGTIWGTWRHYSMWLEVSLLLIRV